LEDNPIPQGEQIRLKAAELVFNFMTVLIDDNDGDGRLVEVQPAGFFSHTPPHSGMVRGSTSKINFTSVISDTIWPLMANIASY
jgi:hypothetical protein